MTKEPSPGSKLTLADFLCSVPPGVTKAVTTRIGRPKTYTSGVYLEIALPKITLYCGSDICSGMRVFETDCKHEVQLGEAHTSFWDYCCKNCNSAEKTFAVAFVLVDTETLEITKVGEVPAFGQPLPPKLLKLAGDERDYLLKGRRCENQGLGIAAFAYYRRVIETQKNRLLDEIIRVSKALNASDGLLKELDTAKSERRFSQAIESIKHGLPEALLINGHNPLSLLHNALSEGLHAATDEECLELATSIRVVFADLADRLAQAIKDDEALTTALGRLLRVKAGAQ